ncbi:hypothetical protein [Sulfuriflexus mobilis]|uniref:hypothetical protein n=1 Tax=Sulfuriflexus mobilis TaxID=1811807 RepID=UPI000F81FE88|nr:hypothetical protein [Sulfuriflexus mobilis]
MAIRTFIFCDVCNPQGNRAIDNGSQYGRRYADGRAWFEGDPQEASENGWVCTSEGHNLCPRCHTKGLERLLDEKKVEPAATEVVLNV